LKSDSGNVQTQILGTLNEFMAPADVILCAAGSLPGDLDRLWRCELPKTYHLETDIPVWVMKWQGRLVQN
jgi:3D-(3,5/4)-trihydroxycyclohexane-1,2-dione acylhydrolase (decyclizing)